MGFYVSNGILQVACVSAAHAAARPIVFDEVEQAPQQKRRILGTDLPHPQPCAYFKIFGWQGLPIHPSLHPFMCVWKEKNDMWLGFVDRRDAR